MTKLDDMLSKWPMRDATQLEADEAAERVTTAITSGQLPSSVDESLFAPPLPKTPDEGQTSAPRISSKPGLASPGIAVENKMSKDRTRDRTSFQELAKLATTPPPPSSVVPSAPTSSGQTGVLRAKEAESSDSGIVDLKMIAQLDPAGEQRAQSTPLASDGLFDDESAPPKPAVTAAVAEKAMASAQPVAATAVAQPTSAKAAVAKKEEKKGGGGVVLAFGAIIAAAAIAAGGFFFVKYQRAHHAAVATQSAPAADTAKAGSDKPAATTAQTTGTPAASVAQNDTQVPDVSDPNAGTSKSMPKIRVKPGAGGGGGGAAAPQDNTPAPTGTVDPKLVANLPTGGAGGGSGDLAEAMKAAAGGGTGLGSGGGTNDQGTKFAPGSVPQRPSQGQVAGAIGSVMPSAKACLGGDDPMSRANVTFQSDGTVKSVTVTGFAAGKPQEACIKAALSKAKVDPFAEATYPVPVSIRSN